MPQSSAVRSVREKPVRDPHPSPRLRRCAGGSSPCSAPRRAALWMICSLALVRSAGPGAPTPASSRPLRRKFPVVEGRADALSPAANDTCDPSSKASHERLCPVAPGICSVTVRTFPGMAPYPGQARCLALGFWPECFRRLDVKGGRRPYPEETRSALDIEGKHVTIQGPSPDLCPAARMAPDPLVI
jgi:hypothetical protein